MPGYSGTPLATKLGLKEGGRLLLVSPAAAAGIAEFGRELEPLPPGAVVVRGGHAKAAFDVALLFVTTEAGLVSQFSATAARLTTSGGLWVCWPKKSSGVASELAENDIRAFGLGAGMVDNKVCAVTEIWSGLRFVLRLRDREAAGKKSTPAAASGRLRSDARSATTRGRKA